MSFSSIDLSHQTTNSLQTPSLNSLLPPSSSSASHRNQISPISASSTNQYSKIREENGNDAANNINNRLTADSLALLNEMSGQLASMKANTNHNNHDMDHASNYGKHFNDEKVNATAQNFHNFRAIIHFHFHFFVSNSQSNKMNQSN